MANNFKVTVISPKEILLDTYATSVSGKNKNGKFDILKDHAHFISIFIGNIKIETEEKKYSFRSETGIIRCWDNSVQIYLVKLLSSTEHPPDAEIR